MADRPLTRGKAVTWWAVLFVLSVFGSAFVAWQWYAGANVVMIMLLYALLFVCASALGLKADYEEIKKGLGAGVKTLVQPEPRWALATLIVLVLIWPVVGFAWFWRATLPLAAGVVAGFKWARQSGEAGEVKVKSMKEDSAPVDIWKPVGAPKENNDDE